MDPICATQQVMSEALVDAAANRLLFVATLTILAIHIRRHRAAAAADGCAPEDKLESHAMNPQAYEQAQYAQQQPQQPQQYPEQPQPYLQQYPAQPQHYPLNTHEMPVQTMPVYGGQQELAVQQEQQYVSPVQQQYQQLPVEKQ